jgi:hypothetical protein
LDLFPGKSNLNLKTKRQNKEKEKPEKIDSICADNLKLQIKKIAFSI